MANSGDQVNLGTLYINIVVSDQTNAAKKLSEVGEAASRAGRGVRGAVDDIRALELGLITVSFQARVLVQSFMNITRSLIEFSGINVASQFQMLHVGFKNILDDSGLAVKMLDELKQLGARTPFKTDELIRFSRMMLAAGFSASDLTEKVQILADATAALGLETEAVGRLAYVMGQIRSRPMGLAGDERRQLQNLFINLGRVVGAATGQSMNSQQAISYLSSKTGEEVAEILLRGLNVLFGGSALSIGTTTMFGIVQNLMETFRYIMLPTGKLLLPILQALGSSLLKLAEFAERINRWTFGFAGLALIVYGFYRAWGLVIGAIRLATSAIVHLYHAVMRLTGAASYVPPAPGAIIAAGRSRMRGMFTSPMLPFTIGTAGVVAGSVVGGNIGNIVSNASMLAMLGFMLGGVPGTLLGLLAGVGIGIYDAISSSNRTQQRIEENTRRTANALEEVRISSGGGGGPRTRRIVSDLEIQRSIWGAAVRGAGR